MTDVTARKAQEPGGLSAADEPGLLHATRNLRPNVFAGQAMIQDQWFGIFLSNGNTKNGGAKGIRTPDLLHAMQHDSV
jgi:hypothetical protein